MKQTPPTPSSKQTQRLQKLIERGQHTIAVKTLCLSDGSRLTNQLLQYDSVGRLCSYSPLTVEQPFCEWFRGEWVAE